MCHDSSKYSTGENSSTPELLSSTTVLGAEGPVSCVQVYVGLGKASATHSSSSPCVPFTAVKISLGLVTM